MPHPQQFRDALIEETRRRLFEESYPRLKKCLQELTEEEIWRRPNANSNSVGNLVLHLCGNARQWIVSGLGGQPDNRQRQQEFDEEGPLPTAQLLDMLDVLQRDIEEVLQAIEPEELLRQRPVQVYQETGLSILVHVVEHFSYHVGQISYYVKLRKDIDLKYYGDAKLG